MSWITSQHPFSQPTPDTATRTRWLWRYELETRGFHLPLQQRWFCFYRWLVENNQLGHGRQDGRRS